MREMALIRKFSALDNHSPRRPAFHASEWLAPDSHWRIRRRQIA
jgi:hypothetical protein